MPEGDSLFQLAGKLAPRMVGRAFSVVWVFDRGRVGAFERRVVTSVRSIGKHLVIALEGGGAIRVHLGLRGSCRRMAVGKVSFERPPDALRLVLEVDPVEVGPVEVGSDEADRHEADRHEARPGEAFVFFHAKEVELGRDGLVGSSQAIRGLGPDLLRDAIDLDDVVARARRSPKENLAELLLDQRVAAGIGNVFKSELCFLRRLDPFVAPARVDDAELREVYRLAARTLRENVRGGRRVFVPPVRRRSPGAPRLFAYSRAGRPCLACFGEIRMRRDPVTTRSIYFCPRCQVRPHEDVAPYRSVRDLGTPGMALSTRRDEWSEVIVGAPRLPVASAGASEMDRAGAVDSASTPAPSASEPIAVWRRAPDVETE